MIGPPVVINSFLHHQAKIHQLDITISAVYYHKEQHHKMKYGTALFLLLVSVSSYGATPPMAVLNAFEEKFPAAANTKWAKENSKEWEAEFQLDGQSLSANFSKAGQWMETETNISASALPVQVLEHVHKAYPKAKIHGCARIESANSPVLYEVELKSGMLLKEKIFDESGKKVK